jgi:HlyD family secretion protein
VADLSVMEASVKVDETDVPRITFGDSASLKIDAFPDQVFTGRVTRISNSAIQAAQTGQTQQAVDFEVIITLDSPPAELRPDLSATADIVTDARRGVPAVPIIAVTVRDPDGKKILGGAEEEEGTPGEGEEDPETAAIETEGVFVARGGKAEFLPVTVGIAGDRYFEVIKGLQVGDTVVAGPYGAVRDLEDGATIRTQAAAAEETPKAKAATKEAT